MALFRARVQLVFTASTLNFRCSLVPLLLWGHRQGWEPLTAVQGSERSMYQSTRPHLKKYECFVIPHCAVNVGVTDILNLPF